MSAWPHQGGPASDEPLEGDGSGPPLDWPEQAVAGGTRPVRWGIGDVWLGLVVGLVGSNFAAVMWLLATDNFDEPDALVDAPIALLQAGLWLGLLGAPLVASWVKGRRSLRDDFGLDHERSDVPLGLGAGLVTQLVVIPILYVPILWFLDDSTDLGAPARELTERASGLGILVLVLTVVIGAPIVEELFFRGLALRAFERRWGTGWGVALSSVLFGLTHFQLLQLPALIAFGVVLGVLTVRTGRLGAAMWAHVVFNGAAVASQLLL